MFTQTALNTIISNILGICPVAFQAAIARGTRPVKAALKLGADIQLAQLVGSLQLATSVEEIDTVYADERTKSCMVGYNVGEFYSAHGIGVIHAPNYRRLVGLETGVLAPRGYGFHGYKVDDLLGRQVMEGSGDSILAPQFWESTYRVEVDQAWAGETQHEAYRFWNLQTPNTYKGTSWWNLSESVRNELMREAVLEGLDRFKDDRDTSPWLWGKDAVQVHLPDGFRLDIQEAKPYKEFCRYELAELRRVFQSSYLVERNIPETLHLSYKEGVMRDGTISQTHWKQVKRRFQRNCAILKDIGFRPYIDFSLGEEWEVPLVEIPVAKKIETEKFESELPSRLKLLKPRKNKTGGRKPAKA